MGRGLRAQQLTPLQRLQVRDALQDRWREQVRQITVLTLARYDRDDADGSAIPSGVAPASRSLESSILRARARLEELEQAMRRLDDRSYGHCLGCGGSIGVARLARTPEETRCEGCGPDAAAPADGSSDVSVA